MSDVEEPLREAVIESLHKQTGVHTPDSPWRPITDAPVAKPGDSKPVVVLGWSAQEGAQNTFASRVGELSLWLRFSPRGLVEWEPTLWVPLPRPEEA